MLSLIRVIKPVVNAADFPVCLIKQNLSIKDYTNKFLHIFYCHYIIIHLHY